MANTSARRLDRRRVDWVGVGGVALFLLVVLGLTIRAGFQSQRDKQLRNAVTSGDVQTVQTLLRGGACTKVGIQDALQTLTYQQMKADKKHQIVMALLENGANPNADNLLWSAAQNGDMETLRVLLDRGGKRSLRESGWNSPLIGGINGGQKKAVKFLIEQGADPNAKDGAEQTALTLAVQKNWADVVETLLDKGAHLNQKPMQNMPGPLMTAAQMGYPEIVELLLERGEKPDTKDSFHRTALSYAAGNGNVKSVTLLIAKGADVNADDGQSSVLAYAAKGGNPMVVKLLLEKGADPNGKGDPLASVNGPQADKIARLLKAAGARKP